jgi:hypothetical protein
MGDYADMAFDQGLADREYDLNDPDFVDYDSVYSARRKQPTKYHYYKIHSVISETEKGIHVLFAREDNGQPWAKSFWWPKSQVIQLEEYNELGVPDWLLTLKFDEQSSTEKEPNQ